MDLLVFPPGFQVVPAERVTLLDSDAVAVGNIGGSSYLVHPHTGSNEFWLV